MKISQIITESSVDFGTSGARGLVEKMNDKVCYCYTIAFLQFLERRNNLKKNTTIAVAGDLRKSTNRIVKSIHKAIKDKGYLPLYCGKIPSPALAYYGIKKEIPTIMVTGSHIPDDRNGIKFTKADGEISKSDEKYIKDEIINLDENIFNTDNELLKKVQLPEPSVDAEKIYKERYMRVFQRNSLHGLKVGLYKHSSVGKNLLQHILIWLGAEVVQLHDSKYFIPVDTEAIREEDIKLAKVWSEKFGFDSIVSMDGDSDRPLISDENGNWIKGDLTGILCARFLKADAVITPISSNTAVEKCNLFKEVIRTKIGSPYVIEEMVKARHKGFKRVVGYEANGGFLIENNININGVTIDRLPTRDAIIVILAVLYEIKIKNKKASELLSELPLRFTYSSKIKEFPTEISTKKLAEFSSGNFTNDKSKIEATFGHIFGKIKDINIVDGLRITFNNEDILHMRPSGNAPEFRCYSESSSIATAKNINDKCIKIMQSWKG